MPGGRLPFDCGSDFFPITATAEGVYAGGWSYSLTSDPVGGKEIKAIVSKFTQDGSNGPGPNGSIWTAGSNGTNAPLGAFFAYSGGEAFAARGHVHERGNDNNFLGGAGPHLTYADHFFAKYTTVLDRISAPTPSP